MVSSGKVGKAQVENRMLVDLVNYQEGAVVSRTIMDKRAGTVTLFAFDQEQGLSEHIVPSDALVFLLEGEGDFAISGKSYRLKKGEMILMPANQPHAVRAISKFKMLLVMMKSS